MRLERAFIELQWQFAHKVAALSGKPLPEVLLSHTNFYIRFGLGRDFNPNHPGWQRFLAGLEQSTDPLECSWQTYLQCPPERSAPVVSARSGCFAYTQQGQSLRLHFSPLEGSQTSLGKAALLQRQAELQALFAQAWRHFPESTPVQGCSWLYNLEAYRRLFPAAYLLSSQPVAPRYHSMTLWGQFLGRRGSLNPRMTRSFRERLETLKSLEELAQCFPFQLLRLEAPLAVFLNGI